MKSVALVLFPILALISISHAAIEVADAKGRTMEVDVISYIPKTGMTKIKRTDGQVFEVNINVFDASSQKLIIENAPKPRAELLVRVSVGKRDKRQNGSSYMKDQTISATMTVDNDSRYIDFQEGKGTLFLIVRQTKRFADRDSDYGKVLSKQVIDISVKASEERKFEAQKAYTSFDSDRDSTNVGGFSYYGYLFILQDNEGEIHTVDTSIGNLKKDVESDTALAEKLLGLTENSIVAKSLEKL